MNLYKNGQYVETFKQSRDIDILTNYLAAHAEPRNPPEPEPTKEDEKTLPLTAEKDELVEQIATRGDVNPGGIVLSLDERNFQETIDKGHVFVKFFAPWSVPSRVPRW